MIRGYLTFLLFFDIVFMLVIPTVVLSVRPRERSAAIIRVANPARNRQ